MKMSDYEAKSLIYDALREVEYLVVGRGKIAKGIARQILDARYTCDFSFMGEDYTAHLTPEGNTMIKEHSTDLSYYIFIDIESLVSLCKTSLYGKKVL